MAAIKLNHRRRELSNAYRESRDSQSMNKKLQLGQSNVIRLLGSDAEGYASEMRGTRVYTNTS